MENFSNNQFKIFGDFVEDEILKKIQVKCANVYNLSWRPSGRGTGRNQ